MHRRHFAHINIGSWVWFYECGQRDAEPYPALVTRKYKNSQSIDVTIYAQEQRMPMRFASGLRHIDDPDYLEHQKTENGAWEPTPADKLLMELSDARRS